MQINSIFRRRAGFARVVSFFKLVFAVGIVAQISGCVLYTPLEDLVAQNQIRVGMTRSDVGSVALSSADDATDPFWGACYYEYDSDSRCEILSGPERRQYLVFCGAYSPSSCSVRYGTSTLKGIYRTYNDAKRSASPAPAYTAPASAKEEAAVPRPVPAPVVVDERATAAKIHRCTKRGLTPGTPAFKKCFAEK